MKLKSLIEAGRRHSAGDQTMLQTMHDHAVSLGATCGTQESDRSVTMTNLAASLSEADAIELSAILAERQLNQSETNESESEEITGDLVPLVEKAVSKDGTIKIKVISPGQGSSGYYPSDVLKRDGPKAFTKGLHVYADHPSVSEESDRPERSVKDLIGSFTSNARWEETGAAGPGLYAEAKIRSDIAPLIEELAPHIGMSIRAMGTAGTRDIDGKKTRTIESIDQARSCDVVTVAGAGGKVLELFESARGRQTSPPQEGADVNKEELEAAQKKIEESERKIAELQERLDAQEQRDQTAKLMREASAIVTEALATMQIPESVRAKVTTELTLNPPLKEGAIDNEALTAKAKERATEEYTYVIEAAGLTGRVIGMGGGPSDVDPKAELASLFEAQGYSKDVAERMAAR